MSVILTLSHTTPQNDSAPACAPDARGKGCHGSKVYQKVGSGQTGQTLPGVPPLRPCCQAVGQKKRHGARPATSAAGPIPTGLCNATSPQQDDLHSGKTPRLPSDRLNIRELASWLSDRQERPCSRRPDRPTHFLRTRKSIASVIQRDSVGASRSTPRRIAK